MEVLLYGLFGMRENMVLKNSLVNNFYDSFKQNIKTIIIKNQKEDLVYAF